ncbi:hypothetical protein KL948_000641 [Ogataea haglerorum]|uniref:uncharacterized protein n=1 Tax=Ogataea haglerorum TaxID=1937702 RepID=UPI001C898AB2|nr:uncharacterized protein KL911_001422 [Ogataea haglerorum]KAG7694277.1 hypothetical protein KL951_004155 [Ogataea haglerorum]KAG7712771.1 hypothetical protein KL950_000642 [Ogataea haglerorum]KAG7735075.1 hypothetical protein KL948_000641 [Ogataea haglerorum]KAG7756620.1 hypothetical protein KL911_001422 [Ogataea haglerorum]KAG7799532.1 hypothetical protein KL944_004130 [Ogataea haglerorum]
MRATLVFSSDASIRSNSRVVLNSQASTGKRRPEFSRIAESGIAKALFKSRNLARQASGFVSAVQSL